MIMYDPNAILFNRDSPVYAEEENTSFTPQTNYLDSGLGYLKNQLIPTLKNYGGRYIASQALSGAGAMINPYLALAGGIAGLLGGGNLFNQNTYSQQMYNNLTSEGKQYANQLYGLGGILQGYNQFSAFGRGTLGTIGNILANNPNMSPTRRSAFREAADRYISSIDPTQQGINAVTKKGGYGYDDAAIKYAPPSGGDSGWSGGSGGFGGGFSTSSSGTEETF